MRLIIPRPDAQPISLLDLYRLHTSDLTATAEQVTSAISTDNLGRRQVISLFLKGYTTPQIGRVYGVSHGAIGTRIKQALVRAWKQINHVGRYYKTGRDKHHYAVVVEEIGGLKILSVHRTEELATRKFYYPTYPDNAMVVCTEAGVMRGEVYTGGFRVVRGKKEKVA